MGKEENILPCRDEIRKACRFMEENLDKPVSLEQITSGTGMWGRIFSKGDYSFYF